MAGHTFGISSLRSDQQELVRILSEARGAASENLADIIQEVHDSGLPYESSNLGGGGNDGSDGGEGSGDYGSGGAPLRTESKTAAVPRPEPMPHTAPTRKPATFCLPEPMPQTTPTPETMPGIDPSSSYRAARAKACQRAARAGPYLWVYFDWPNSDSRARPPATPVRPDSDARASAPPVPRISDMLTVPHNSDARDTALPVPHDVHRPRQPAEPPPPALRAARLGA